MWQIPKSHQQLTGNKPLAQQQPGIGVPRVPWVDMDSISLALRFPPHRKGWHWKTKKKIYEFYGKYHLSELLFWVVLL